MKRIAAALMLLAATSPAFATKVLQGKYTVTYFSGPTHAESDQVCVTFVQTGGVAGFPDSGTWSARKLSKDLGGNFTVDGNVIRFYATYNDGTNVLNHYAIASGTSATGGYDQWDRSVSPLAPIADGTIQMIRGCA
ncbi:MAG TPA: hypothetical protein VFV07_06675 [Rhizomicrobium sp.]|nr:hypothetical protein [Rhizomicrobium sp.]